MIPFTSASTGIKTIVWNDMESLERLNLILKYEDLFLSLKLVTESEMDMVKKMDEEEWTYILEREDQPLFTSINIKKEIEEQNHSKYLESAIESIF